MPLLEDRAVRERVARLDSLLEEVEALADPRARDVAEGAIQGLLELYGEGLARIVEHVCDLPADAAARLRDAFTSDELVSHLLLLHGLHPVDAEARVREAIEDVRGYVEARGASVALLGVEDGVAKVEWGAAKAGCQSTARALSEKIDAAILEAAPDLAAVETRDVTPPAGFVPAGSLRRVERHARA